jgi:hypothetical protein
MPKRDTGEAAVADVLHVATLIDPHLRALIQLEIPRELQQLLGARKLGARICRLEESEMGLIIHAELCVLEDGQKPTDVIALGSGKEAMIFHMK